MFRFESLGIWKKAARVAKRLSDIADELESRSLFRFAEQLRGAALSMPNNIAEGSGSDSDREFCKFVNYAWRSAFENANMIIIFAERGCISSDTKDELLVEFEELCRMLAGFRRTPLTRDEARKL